MALYQITKYNPVYRNRYGIYLMDEWTSISDIGKTFGNRVLKAVEYFTTENMYIKAVKLIMGELGVQQLYVSGLEKSIKISELYEMIRKYSDYYPDRFIEVFRTVEDGSKLSGEDACHLCRLILREHLWCNLYSSDRSFIITFGYDYYMRIFCEEVKKETINAIRDSGLFVEKKEVTDSCLI